jgi:transposase-like protein
VNQFTCEGWHLRESGRWKGNRSVPKQHFRQFSSAGRTIQGYETMREIRKGQVGRVRKGDIRVQNRFIDQVFGLVA